MEQTTYHIFVMVNDIPLLSTTPPGADEDIVVSSEIKKCTIGKDENGSFGLNIVGGVDEPYIPGHTGIFVSRVRRADLLDTVRPGDRIIAVNGTPLEGKKHEEVVALLKQTTGPQCTFTIETNAERNIAMGLTGKLDDAEVTATASAEALDASTINSERFFTPNNSVLLQLDEEEDGPGLEEKDGVADASEYETPQRNGDFQQQSPQQQRDDEEEKIAGSQSAALDASSTQAEASSSTLADADSLSLASSNVSTVSSHPGGGGGTRTRNSSTSTITYGTVQQNSLLKKADWRIDESDAGTPTDASLAPSSAVCDEPSTAAASSTAGGGARTATAGGRHQQPSYEQSSPSQLLDVLFVSIGACALLGVVYLGYRRMKRGSWL